MKKKMKMKRKMSNALEAEEKNKKPCIDIFVILLFLIFGVSVDGTANILYSPLCMGKKVQRIG